jgi:hypothetical protein
VIKSRECFSGCINQNEAKIIEGMSTKDSIYGLLSPKKLNPNLLLIVVAVVIIVVVLVFYGRHSKISVARVVSIETNIPQSGGDSSSR